MERVAQVRYDVTPEDEESRMKVRRDVHSAAPPSPPQENQNAVIEFIDIRAVFLKYYLYCEI